MLDIPAKTHAYINHLSIPVESKHLESRGISQIFFRNHSCNYQLYVIINKIEWVYLSIIFASICIFVILDSIKILVNVIVGILSYSVISLFRDFFCLVKVRDSSQSSTGHHTNSSHHIPMEVVIKSRNRQY